MNILLVDDSKTMRNIQKNALMPLGNVTFAEAADGVEGLAALTSGAKFDLVLCDWNMPNMDGLQMVTKVRQTDRSTLIVMVTTEAEKQRVIDAVKAGANNYVVKPFTPASLLERVQQTLAKKAA